MAEISNNLLAVLLVVAILVSGFGMLNLMEIGRIRVTGIATGQANVSITGAPSIEMVQNITDFGASDLGGAQRNLSTQADNCCNFSDGTEGNDTNLDLGDCDMTDPINCSRPMVVNNTGNVNVEINISSADDPYTWIHGAGMAYFKGKNNESGACTDWAGFGEGSWVLMNNSPDDRQACSTLQFGLSQNELRIHYLLTVPSATTPGTKVNVITIQAQQV